MIKNFKLFFILFTFLSPFIIAQTVLLPEEEAPKSIFSSTLGGKDVDLYLLGSWETEIRGGYAFSWTSEDSELKESSFPGMLPGLELTHNPDIFISLWLMNSYFFESSFIDNYELNTILFGYESLNENFLRSIRIGNTDIGFGKYSYMNIPAASTDSMGAMALFKNDKTEHQLMLRYDPAEKQLKNYIGQHEVELQRTDLTDYVKGRYFILPDDNVEDLKVYIEDSNGTYSDSIANGSHKYRLADSNDAIISAEEGIVFFRESLDVRAAVHYTKGGVDVGDVTIGSDAFAYVNSGEIDIDSSPIDFNFSITYLGQAMGDRNLTIDSVETALLLYEPGVFSPFEMLSVYSLPYLIPADPALFKTSLTDINISIGEKLDVITNFEDYMVRILYSGESYRDPANRYPLAASIDTDSLIYEPDKELRGSPSNKELLFQKLSPTGSYYLGDNVLDGSVSVTMNGFDEYRYSFNPDNGVVTFLFPVPADTQIEISYRTMANTGTSGDLLLALGSKYNFSDSFSINTGLGLRWNILDSSYIEQPGDASGSIIGTAGLSYKTENLDFSLDAGISVHSPNTTGILRLAGMNSGGFRVPVSVDFLYPSAIPVSDIAETLNAGNRGKLIYKDYHEYDSSGSSIMKRYDWPELPVDQISNYDTGNRIGPYITDAGTEIEGDSAVFDYDLTANQWVGGRIPITLGSDPLDLSSTQAISFKWKILNSTGSPKVYIRVGKLAEDLDNDTLLDTESSIYDSGFTFNDSFTSPKKIGLNPDGNSPNNQIDTEDLDGNGILDKEGSNLVFVKTPSIPGNSWGTLTLNLNSSEREKLKAVTGFEIIIVENAGSTATGRLIVGDITFEGSSFITNPLSGQNVTAKEINEVYATEPMPYLTEDYPETAIFSTSAGAQNVAEIYWDAIGNWEATSFTEAVDLSDYNKISFYMKTPNNDPSFLTFSLLNPSGEGISLKFAPIISSTDWTKYTIDYRNGTLTANGTGKSIISWPNRNINAENVNRLTLSANCINGAGTLLLDEVHMEDPVVGVSGAASTDFNYRYPGTILSHNEKPIISNFNFGNSSSIKGPNFGSGFTDNKDSTIYTASTLGVSLLKIQINSNLGLEWQNNELFTSPGISFSIPFFENNLIVFDKYSEKNLPLSSSVIRESSITTNLGISSFIVSANTSQSFPNMTRNWKFSSNSAWEKGSTLNSSADFRMTSIEDPYKGMNLFEKISNSYIQYLPGSIQNDRNSKFSLSPTLKLPLVTIGLEEALLSSNAGLTDRIINSGQLLTLHGSFILNSDNSDEWNIVSNYKKNINITNSTNNNYNFFTDTNESLYNIGTQKYYFTGIPLWEILYPDFADQFIDSSSTQQNAEYIPDFSIQFYKLPGSHPVDLILPSSIDLQIQRNLKKDFDSITDSLKINFETKATALNIFGNLGTTPRFNWYQTEEITNIMSIGGEFKSYRTELFKEPIFSLNYSLFINLTINQKDSIELQSSQNFEWVPLVWKSSSSGSYNWQKTPNKPIVISFLDATDGEMNPYFEHKEKITLLSTTSYEQKENSFTLTANHSTNLIFPDRGNISIYAGIGFDKKSISNANSATDFFLVGIEAGISLKLTF